MHLVHLVVVLLVVSHIDSQLSTSLSRVLLVLFEPTASLLCASLFFTKSERGWVSSLEFLLLQFSLCSQFSCYNTYTYTVPTKIQSYFIIILLAQVVTQKIYQLVHLKSVINCHLISYKVTSTSSFCVNKIYFLKGTYVRTFISSKNKCFLLILNGHLIEKSVSLTNHKVRLLFFFVFLWAWQRSIRKKRDRINRKRNHRRSVWRTNSQCCWNRASLFILLYLFYFYFNIFFFFFIIIIIFFLIQLLLVSCANETIYPIYLWPYSAWLCS